MTSSSSGRPFAKFAPNKQRGEKWSIDEEFYLTELWLEGYSYTMIMRRMQIRFGHQYSRSCIAGKRKRLMLPERPTRHAADVSIGDRGQICKRPVVIKSEYKCQRKPSFRTHPKREELIDRMYEMREQGDSIRNIAESLGLTVRAVYWQCAINGIHPKDKPPVHYQTRFETYRCGRIVRSVRPEEENEMVRLRVLGFTTSAIARRVKRANATVRFRLAVRAAREEAGFI